MPTRARDIILTDQTRRWLRWIGSWQMLGGVASALVLLDSYRRLPSFGGTTVVVLGICLLLALVSVAAGYALTQHRAEGVRASLGLQLLQILAVSTDTHFFQLIFGPSITLDLVWQQGVRLSFAFRPAFQFHFPAAVPLNAGVSINFLALACFLILLFLKTAPPPVPAALATNDSDVSESAA